MARARQLARVPGGRGRCDLDPLGRIQTDAISSGVELGDDRPRFDPKGGCHVPARTGGHPCRARGLVRVNRGRDPGGRRTMAHQRLQEARYGGSRASRGHRPPRDSPRDGRARRTAMTRPGRSVAATCCLDAARSAPHIPEEASMVTSLTTWDAMLREHRIMAASAMARRRHVPHPPQKRSSSHSGPVRCLYAAVVARIATPPPSRRPARHGAGTGGAERPLAGRSCSRVAPVPDRGDAVGAVVRAPPSVRQATAWVGLIPFGHARTTVR
jgi:hypothetical protein